MLFAFTKECFDSGTLLSNVYELCIYQQSDVFHLSTSKNHVGIRLRNSKFWCPLCQHISWFLKFVSFASGNKLINKFIQLQYIIYCWCIQVLLKWPQNSDLCRWIVGFAHSSSLPEAGVSLLLRSSRKVRNGSEQPLFHGFSCLLHQVLV